MASFKSKSPVYNAFPTITPETPTFLRFLMSSMFWLHRKRLLQYLRLSPFPPWLLDSDKKEAHWRISWKILQSVCCSFKGLCWWCNWSGNNKDKTD